MKKLILTTLSILFFLYGYGQRTGSNNKSLIDSVKKNSPLFVNDMSSNALSQSEIFNEVTPTGFDLFNANISFTDKDQVQKVGFSPLRLSTKYYGVLSNLRLNLTNKSGQLTSGISIGYDNTAYESKRVKRLFDEFTSKMSNFPPLPNRLANESIDDYKKRTSAYNKSLDSLASGFDDARLNNVVKLSWGYNSQFFSVLKSKSNSSNFDSLNYHGFKGHNLFINGSYGYKMGCFTIEGAVNYFNKRKSADSIQTKNNYLGYSAGITKRIIRLISDEKVLKSKAYYKNTRFIPSIYVGFAFEKSMYKGSDYRFAEENANSLKTYTPYIDVCISTAVQFRLALPIKSVDEYAKATQGKTIGTILSFNYKLVNLSN